MKTQMATQFPQIRNLFARFALLTFLTFSIATLQAQDSTRKPFADVKYLGLVNGKLMLQIEIVNDSPESFTIEIKDEKGNQFFHEKFREQKFKRQFSLDRADVDNAVKIEITNRSVPQKQTFTLNATTRIVDYVSIVKQ